MQNQLFNKFSKLLSIYKYTINRANTVYSNILSFVGKYPILVTTIYLVLIGNHSFWSSYKEINSGASWHVFLFALSFVILIIVITSIIFSIVRFKYLLKPVLIFILFASSFASYFLDNYGFSFKSLMI